MHTARMWLTHGTLDQLARMAEDTEGVAELLSTPRHNILALADTTSSSISSIGGPGWDEKLISRIE